MRTLRLSAIVSLVAGACLFAPRPVRAQTPPPPPPPVRTPPRDSLSDSVRALLRQANRDARAEARRQQAADSASIRARGEAAASSAFADDNARVILERARAARLQQDSALRAYRAKATQRISLGMGVKRTGIEKLMFRGDNVAMVAWQRGVGVWVTPIGSRMTIPMADQVGGEFFDAIAIPYFPGREQLWMPTSNMGTVRADIDEREMIHPVARGAEAYYRYATGDSVDIRLPDGKLISIRELRITARKPDWRVFVGSFWFDRETGQLVRAAYRLSVDLEIWDVVSEENSRDKEFNEALAVVRDSIMRARLPREEYVRDSVQRARANRNGNNDDDPPGWVKAMFRPAKARLDGVTIEYGLYEGRFWLPRANSATATAEVGFMRMPLEINEKFEYEMVNGAMNLPPLPAARTVAGRVVDTARTGEVSVTVGGRPDSASIADARYRADSARAARRGVTCQRDSTYTRLETRYNGALRLAYEIPCDGDKLRNSPALPPAYGSDEKLFDGKARDELLSMLDLGLQPAWAPERPSVRTGLDLMRYNRVEGLSIGALATQNLGAGYTLYASGRLGHADRHLNGEFTVERSNGRRVVRATTYHRLSAVNPEWASALSFGSSLPALLYTRDEGFYYRNFGVELTDRRERPGQTLEYRLFVERQWTAGDSTVANTFSIGSAISDRQFIQNIVSERVSMSGVSADWMRSFTVGQGSVLHSRIRAEAATGTFEYGRLALDVGATRQISRFAAAITASGGSSVGRVPFQRLWYMGGVQTVRGQIAGTQSGDAYWLARAELGTRQGIVRPVGFFDIGWAGSRDAIGRTQPQRGTGIGLSLLDGLFRLDVSRGLYPNKRWRTDLYLQAPL